MGESDPRLRAGISKDLERVPQWEMTDTEWAEIGQMLASIEAAIDEDDAKTAIELTEAVKRKGAERQGLIFLNDERPTLKPAPIGVRGILNEMVHGGDPDGSSS